MMSCASVLTQSSIIIKSILKTTVSMSDKLVILNLVWIDKEKYITLRYNLCVFNDTKNMPRVENQKSLGLTFHDLFLQRAN